MKLPCEIVRDLLLLYADDACSPESRKAAEEHLSQCSACRRHLQALTIPELMAEEAPEPETAVQERIMRNGFRKMRRRWLISVLSVFLLFPALLLAIFGVHEYRGEGAAFTNLDEIFVSRRLIKLIEAQRFEEAAELMDFETRYQDIQEILERSPEDYLPAFEWCMVDGEAWAAKAWPEEQYQLQTLCEDGEQLWGWLLLNRIEGILVPEAVWEQLHLLAKKDIEYREVAMSYFPIDTPWGRFYTNCTDVLTEEEITAELLFELMNFVPGEIYRKAQESLEKKALEQYQENREYYAFAADMTQEDFVREMKSGLIRALEACYSNGVTIQNPHFTGAYRIGQQWNIQISATLKYPAGQSFLINYHFMVRNGKLRITSSSHPEELTGDPIGEALRQSRP